MPEEFREIMEEMKQQALQNQKIHFKVHAEEHLTELCLSILDMSARHRKNSLTMAKDFWKLYNYMRKLKLSKPNDKKPYR